jgi:hypothetical protein
MYEVTEKLENVHVINEVNNPGTDAAPAVQVYINNSVGVQGRILARDTSQPCTPPTL